MYGESGDLMRTQLASLLRYQRVLHPLGVRHEAPDPAARARIELILSYRQSILTWCIQSATTARPLAFSNLPPRGSDPFRPTTVDRPPVIELIGALELASGRSDVRSARLEDLTTEQPNELVEKWRTAAKAAALAEHDTGPDYEGRLSTPQAQALLGDVCAVTQALIILDQRHRSVPGWQALAGTRRLAWTTLACALDVGLGKPDYSIDQTGWRPKVKILRHPVAPGIANVLKAEHNLLVRLGAFPSATNLRYVVDSQRILSHRLADLADRVAPDLARRWTDRSETYTLFQRELRNLGGNTGRGGLAVAEGANAVSRLREVSAGTLIQPHVLRAFQTVFDGIDARIADIVEEGVRRGALLQRVQLPRVVGDAHKMVQPVRERFVVVTEASDLPVRKLVRERLRPVQPAAGASSQPGHSRAALNASIVRNWPTQRRYDPPAPSL